MNLNRATNSLGCSYKTPRQQQLYYTPDVSQLIQSCDDTHFMWKDIQLSKGSLNKDRIVEAEIKGESESLHFRSAPCGGVKFCPVDECSHTVPIREKRNCPTHNKILVRTTCCPVGFIYIYTSRITLTKGDGLVA